MALSGAGIYPGARKPPESLMRLAVKGILPTGDKKGLGFHRELQATLATASLFSTSCVC